MFVPGGGSHLRTVLQRLGLPPLWAISPVARPPGVSEAAPSVSASSLSQMGKRGENISHPPRAIVKVAGNTVSGKC